MRALVTGASGFVGRHMVAELVNRGAERITCVDKDPVPFDEWGPISTYTGDIRWLFRQETLARYDLVVHCAAVVGGRAMIEGRPLELACEDLSIDAALFSWAMKAKPGRIVYYSSSAAYPIHLQDDRALKWAGIHEHPRNWRGGLRLREVQIDPDAPDMPDQTYGWVKLTGERLAREYQAAGGKVTVLRPFSGYGSDQDLSYPFPAIMERVRRGDDPIDVWGPGTQVRDWIHIDDVIAGTLAAVDAEVDEPLNLCTGRAVSFLELVNLARRDQIDRGQRLTTVSTRTNPDQPTGVMYRCGDPTKMLDVYEPKVTLEEGIRRALTDTS